MDKKMIGTGLAVTGILILLVSLTADITGLGAHAWVWLETDGRHRHGPADLAGGLVMRQRAS